MDKLTEAASPYTQLTKEIRELRREVADTLLASKNVRSQNKIIKLKLDCIKKDRRASKYVSTFLFSVAAIVQVALYFKVLKLDESSELVSLLLKLLG